jgi:hypothetical protein
MSLPPNPDRPRAGKNRDPLEGKGPRTDLVPSANPDATRDLLNGAGETPLLDLLGPLRGGKPIR